MGYIGTREAARRWVGSDRRSRTMCANGKIPGAIKRKKSCEIPTNAERPDDGRAGVDHGGSFPAANIRRQYQMSLIIF